MKGLKVVCLAALYVVELYVSYKVGYTIGNAIQDVLS